MLHSEQESGQLPFLSLELFENIDVSPFQQLLTTTYFELGKLEGKLGEIENPELLLMSVVIMESVKSSTLKVSIVP